MTEEIEEEEEEDEKTDGETDGEAEAKTEAETAPTSRKNPDPAIMPLAKSMAAMEDRITSIQEIIGTRLAAGDIPPIEDIEAFFHEWLLSSIVLGTDMKTVLPKMKMVMDISRRAKDRNSGKKKITIDVLKKLIDKGNREKKKREKAERAAIEEEFNMREPEYRVGNG